MITKIENNMIKYNCVNIINLLTHWRLNLCDENITWYYNAPVKLNPGPSVSPSGF